MKLYYTNFRRLECKLFPFQADPCLYTSFTRMNVRPVLHPFRLVNKGAKLQVHEWLALNESLLLGKVCV